MNKFAELLVLYVFPSCSEHLLTYTRKTKRIETGASAEQVADCATSSPAVVKRRRLIKQGTGIVAVKSNVEGKVKNSSPTVVKRPRVFKKDTKAVVEGKGKSSETRIVVKSTGMDAQTNESDVKPDINYLTTRTSPNKLMQFFKELTEVQRMYFSQTIFGNLVYQKVGRLPIHYALYIVEHYDHRSQLITIKDGSTLTVDEKSVHLALGFPWGDRSMLKRPDGLSVSDAQAIIDDWLAQFDMDKKNSKKRPGVTLSDLKALIKSDHVLGPTFVRNVIVYIISAIIWSNGTDSVYLDPIPHLQDLDKLHELNWCEFVMNRLSLAKANFVNPNRTHKSFDGPILFLLIHYSDMVVDCERTVERTLPRLLGWSTQALNAREKHELDNGFGHGYIAKLEDDPKDKPIRETAISPQTIRLTAPSEKISMEKSPSKQSTSQEGQGQGQDVV